MHPVRVTIDALLLPAPANIGYAAFLVILAAGVHNRKRVAYWMLVAYFAAQLAVRRVRPARPGRPRRGGARGCTSPWYGPWAGLANLIVTLAVLVTALAGSHDEFYAKVQRASLPKALATLGRADGRVLAARLGRWSSCSRARCAPGYRRLVYSVRERRRRCVRLRRRPGTAGPRPGSTWSSGVLGAIALFAALFVAAALAARGRLAGRRRGAPRPANCSPSTGERDSLGYFATRRDKEVIFSPSGKAAVTYRVVFGVTLASGDPIGDPEAWAPAIEAWLREAREYAWTPAVMGASEEGATAYARAGLRVIELGDEAILHVGAVRPRRPRHAPGPPGGPPGRAGRLHGARSAGTRTSRRTEMARIIELADALARHRDRARLLDGARAGSATRPTAGACSSRRTTGTGREVGAAVVHAVGRGRAVARPDAPRPGRRTTGSSSSWWPALMARRAAARRQPGVAELRGVPLGVRGGRAGSAPGRSCALGGRCCCSCRAGSSWSRCTGRTSSTGPSGCRGSSATRTSGTWPRSALASGVAEGFVVGAEPADAAARAGTRPTAGRRARGARRSRAGAAPPSRGCPSRPRVRLSQSWTRCAPTAIDPYPPGFGRTHTPRAVRAAHPGLPPDIAHRRQGRRRRPGRARCATTARCASPRCGTGPATCR